MAESDTEPTEETQGDHESRTETSIHRIVTDLIHSLEGIKSSEELVLPLLQVLASKSKEDFEKFISESEIETVASDGKSTKYFVPFDHDAKFRKHRRESRSSSNAIFQAPRALFVAMVSRYDAFIGHLLRAIFLKQPGLIASSQRSLTFTELVAIESLDDARRMIIDAEIDSFLRDSHSSQFDWLENRFGLPLRKGLECWPTFVELTQRRNLFVHCDGVVTHQYVSECTKHGVSLEDIEPGKRLHIGPEYFQTAYECLFEISVKLAHVLWRKIAPDELQDADRALNETCFELLQEDRFDLALPLLEFATVTLKKHSSSLNRRIFVVNRAIASKFGKPKNHVELLDAEDWSDCGKQFALAVAVLKDDFSTAASIMKEFGSDSKDVGKFEYGTWPLFREFRTSDVFQSTYKEIFGEEFSIQKDEPDDSKVEEPMETNEGQEGSADESVT